MDGDVGQIRVLLPPHFDVRADGVGVHRLLGLVRPFLQRLGHQSQRRDQEENACVAFLLSEAFGDLKGREGLAGAAGHDQLAAVVVDEALHRGNDGVVLVRAEPLLVMQLRSLGGVRQFVRGPVNVRIAEIRERDE